MSLGVYTKICVICQKKFFAMRINKIYCSKTCANRTRYLPKELVEQLIARNSKFTLNANKYAAITTGINGEEPEEINTGIDQKELHDLETLARIRKREIDQQEEHERKKSLESESGFNTVDTTTTNIPSGTEEESVIGRVMLSSVQDHKDIAQIVGDSNNTTQEPKKYKIRKIGGVSNDKHHE